jgi:SAM-dependent methyltransferase
VYYVEPKEMVAHGYDQIAEKHHWWAGHTRAEERQRYTTFILEQFTAGASLLELGCGVGLPTAKLLAQHFQVTGVDISARHITMARQNVPEATFLLADMTALNFPPNSFDAVVAFYSIIHVPRDEQPGLLRDIAVWLKPGGLFMAAMGTGDVPEDIQPDWLGAPMYWSHFDSPTNQRLVQQAGLHIVKAVEETALEDGNLITFLWMVAQKPGL